MVDKAAEAKTRDDEAQLSATGGADQQQQQQQQKPAGEAKRKATPECERPTKAARVEAQTVSWKGWDQFKRPFPTPEIVAS